MNIIKSICSTLVIYLFLFSLHINAETGELSSEPETAGGEEMILFHEIPSVYSASRYEQKVTEAPSAVSIVTSAEITKYGYQTLAEILNSIRGFYTTYDRNYNYIGVRGFNRPGDYNTRVQLLVDGHRINDNIYNTAVIGTESPIDVDLIDRIEIIRGPSSSLYGANAFFGIINIITKKGRDFKGGEVSGEAGSFHTYKGRISLGNKFNNNIELLLSAAAYDSEGQRLFFREFDKPSTNNGYAENADDDKYQNFFGKLGFKDLTLQANYITRDKSIPTGSYSTIFNDSRTKTIDEQGYVFLRYEHTFANQLNLMSRIYYDMYEYDGDYMYGYGRKPSGKYNTIVRNMDFSRGERAGAELKLNKKFFEKHNVITGAEFLENIRQDQRNVDDIPRAVYLDDRRDSRIWALYIQDEIQLLNKLIVNAGVRYDHYNLFGGTANPRLALIYSPSNETTFKIMYGKAFRSPNAYELYYHDSGNTSKPNHDLEPETIKTYELVYEQYIGESLRFNVSSYIYNIKRLINQKTDPADGLIVFYNSDNVSAKGLELEIEGKLPGEIESRASYSLQTTEDKGSHKELTNSPNHLAKLNVMFPLIKEKLSSGIELQYTSSRKTLDRRKAGGFFITNITLFSQNIINGLGVSGSIYNLFDKKYGVPVAEEHRQNVIVQDGISFRLKFTYSF